MLPQKIEDPYRNVRMFFCGFGVFCGLWGCIFPIVDIPVLMTVVCCILGIGLILFGRILFPYVLLSHEGVVTRFFFREKSYSWNEIIQFGRYWSDRRLACDTCFELVLVFANGSPKQPGKDRNFLKRNYMNAIMLPNKRQIRLFIEENYGCLDFDDYEYVEGWEKRVNKLDET